MIERAGDGKCGAGSLKVQFLHSLLSHNLSEGASRKFLSVGVGCLTVEPLLYQEVT